MAEKRRGLGRGLGALIPQSTKNSGSAEKKAAEREVVPEVSQHSKAPAPALADEPMSDGLFEMAHEAKPEKPHRAPKHEAPEPPSEPLQPESNHADSTHDVSREHRRRSLASIWVRPCAIRP